MAQLQTQTQFWGAEELLNMMDLGLEMELSITILVFYFLGAVNSGLFSAYKCTRVQHFGKDNDRLSIACVDYGLKKTAVCGKQWERQPFFFLVPAKNQL